MSVISLGRWKCFICRKFGERGWRGFAKHYDTHHLDTDD